MYDLAIVGAGPAGAAAALSALAARPDAAVVLLDRAAFPRDKACGDAIGPHAVALVHRLGAAPAVAGYRAVTWFELSSIGSPLAVRLPLPDTTYTIPRRLFDGRLVHAAVAQLRHWRVRGLQQRRGYVVIDNEIAARVVVAADGASSRVRTLLGQPSNPPEALVIAMRGYAPAGDVDGQRIVLDDARWPAYGWRFAIGDLRTRTAQRPIPRSPGATLVARVREQAAGHPVTDLSAHHLPLSIRRPVPAYGSVLLAGDAASLINPLSGEGIYYALLSGAIAGRLAVITPPDHVGSRYRKAVERRLGWHFVHTRVAAHLITHRRVRAAGLRAAARSSAAFADLAELALGDGRLTPRLLAATARTAVPPLARSRF